MTHDEVKVACLASLKKCENFDYDTGYYKGAFAAEWGSDNTCAIGCRVDSKGVFKDFVTPEQLLKGWYRSNAYDVLLDLDDLWAGRNPLDRKPSDRAFAPRRDVEPSS